MGQTISRDLLFKAIENIGQRQPQWIRDMQGGIDRLNVYRDKVDIGYVQGKARQRVEVLRDERLTQNDLKTLNFLRNRRDDYKFILECLPQWCAAAQAIQKAS